MSGVEGEARDVIERNRERLGGRSPAGNWGSFQRWRQCLFMHYQVRPESIRALVPEELDIDTYPNKEKEHVAWVTMVPMHMVDLSLHGLPPIAFENTFPELNMRTYVSYAEPDGTKRHGIYFFRIDAPPRIADWGARHFFHLPYYHSNASITDNDDGSTTFVNDYSPWTGTAGKLKLRYKAQLSSVASDPGAEYLAERYCAFTKLNSETLLRGDIVHDAWQFHEVDVDVEENSMWDSVGVEVLDRPPHSLYSQGVDCVLWSMVGADEI